MKNPFDPIKQAGYWNTWESGRLAGEAKVRRLERRATMKAIDKFTWGGAEGSWIYKETLQAWLAARSKRKGGEREE